MGKRPGSSLKIPSERTQRRKAALTNSLAERKKALSYLPTLLGLIVQNNPEPETPERYVVVLTVEDRRYRLHTLRERADQDCWLLDYSRPDPELTLDWGMLIENASIESKGEP